ncbi:MAG: hypothetical protein AMXMBFR13_16330 [Phycisphaerae bacterium]
MSKPWCYHRQTKAVSFRRSRVWFTIRRMIRRLLAAMDDYPAWLCVLVMPLALLLGVLWCVFWPFRAMGYSFGQAADRLLGPVFASLRRRASGSVPDRLRRTGWTPQRADDLLRRTSRVQCLLLGLLALEWGVLVLVGLLGGMSFLLGVPGDSTTETTLMAAIPVLLTSGLTALLVQHYYHRLVQAWQRLDARLCGACGYIRDYLGNERCPECGSELPPLEPGDLPLRWKCWDPVLRGVGAGLPIGLAGTMAFVSLWLSQFLPEWWTGVLLLSLTGSVAGVVAYVLGATLQLCRSARRHEANAGPRS